jgi:hypothetical protein
MIAMSDDDQYTYATLLIAAQQALLGEIDLSVRGVAVEWREKMIYVYFYNDGDVSDDLHDNFTTIGAEIVAQFTDAGIIEKIKRWDYPKRLPDHEYWVYKRKECPPMANA